MHRKGKRIQEESRRLRDFIKKKIIPGYDWEGEEGMSSRVILEKDKKQHVDNYRPVLWRNCPVQLSYNIYIFIYKSCLKDTHRVFSEVQHNIV